MENETAKLGPEQILIVEMAAKIFASRTSSAADAIEQARKLLAVVGSDMLAGKIAAEVFSSRIESTTNTQKDMDAAASAARNLIKAVSKSVERR